MIVKCFVNKYMVLYIFFLQHIFPARYGVLPIHGNKSGSEKCIQIASGIDQMTHSFLSNLHVGIRQMSGICLLTTFLSAVKLRKDVLLHVTHLDCPWSSDLLVSYVHFSNTIILYQYMIVDFILLWLLKPNLWSIY